MAFCNDNKEVIGVRGLGEGCMDIGIEQEVIAMNLLKEVIHLISDLPTDYVITRYCGHRLLACKEFHRDLELTFPNNKSTLLISYKKREAL